MRIATLLLLLAPVSLHAEAATAPAEAGPIPGSGTLAPGDELLRLRDPFKRPEIQIGKLAPRSEIEMFPVDAFKMVAVVTGPTRLRAMILAPDGRTYMVNSGMKIGTRGGVIRKVTAEQIEVRERIVNILGQEENVDTVIPLLSDRKSVPGTANAAAR